MGIKWSSGTVCRMTLCPYMSPDSHMKTVGVDKNVHSISWDDACKKKCFSQNWKCIMLLTTDEKLMCHHCFKTLHYKNNNL